MDHMWFFNRGDIIDVPTCNQLVLAKVLALLVVAYQMPVIEWGPLFAMAVPAAPNKLFIFVSGL